MTSGGTVVVSVAADVVTDGAGNGNTASMVGIIVRVDGADTTTPEDVTPVTAHRVLNTNDATPPSVDVTTATDGALVLQYCGLNLGTTASKTMGAPSGYTLDANAVAVETASSANDLQAAVAYKTQSPAGAVGTNPWTNTADDATSDFVAAVIVVRPAITSVSVAVLTTAGAASGAAVGNVLWEMGYPRQTHVSRNARARMIR
jgi:hypothetical protein